MTVGEVIALLCKQAIDKDMYLMVKSIYSIEVNDEEIYLCFTDGNTENYSIRVESEEKQMDLGAYVQIEDLDKIAKDNGIDVPRLETGQHV